MEGIGSSKGFAQRGSGYNTDGGSWICCVKTTDSDLLAGNIANCNCDYELDFNCTYTPTAIHLINKIKVEIFPNPATNYIEVKYDDKQSFKIEIFSINGQLLNQTNGQHIIPLDMLPNGIFSIKITDNISDVFIVDKFIVAK